MSELLMPARHAGAELTQPEFRLTSADFACVCRLIHQHAGIHLGQSKQAMVYSRLSRRLRDTGHTSFEGYLRWLQAGDATHGQAEWQHFVNSLTTNLTAFFREDHHFSCLADDLRQRAGRRLRIWCNAASTGEEPYSLAMTVLETLGEQAPVSILATDIDTEVLETARQGVYAADARGLSAERLRRHFLRGKGAHEGKIRSSPQLTRLLNFRPFNLMQSDWQFAEPFDIVFCRNVMIYFDAPTQRSLLQRMHGCMAGDGLLYVGHSENFSDSHDLFQLRGKTIYQRV